MLTTAVRRDGYYAFGQMHPRAVFPAVEHEIAVGRTLPFAVEAAEDMIELQRGRKLHKRPPSGNCADFVT